MQTGLDTVHRLEAALGPTRRLLTSGRPEDLDRAQVVLVEARTVLEALAASPDLGSGRTGLAEALGRLGDTIRRYEQLNAAGMTAARDLLAAGGHATGYDVRAQATAPGRGVSLHARA